MSELPTPAAALKAWFLENDDDVRVGRRFPLDRHVDCILKAITAAGWRIVPESVAAMAYPAATDDCVVDWDENPFDYYDAPKSIVFATGQWAPVRSPWPAPVPEAHESELHGALRNTGPCRPDKYPGKDYWDEYDACCAWVGSRSNRKEPHGG